MSMRVLLAADQWDAQAIVQRINESLLNRGYLTWFDLTNMKGEQLWLFLCVSSPVSLLSCTTT
jgi:hypothetical protein